MIITNIKNFLVGSFICCGFSIMLTACDRSNEDYLGGHYTTDGAGVPTTITATAPDGTTWNAGARIGISTGYANYDATARNREYVSETGGNSFVQVTGAPLYIKGNTGIVAYYPFTGMDGAEPVINLNTTDQTQVTDYYFAKIDNVSIANGSQLNLAFHHALTQLQLAITTPAGETITSIRLSGFAQKAEVNPFTLEMKYDVPTDMVFTGSDLRTVTLMLIPQTVSADAGIPARLALIGNIRSYTIDMSGIAMNSGETLQANIDVTDGVGSLEFVSTGSPWTDSGKGGDINTH